MWRQVRKSAAAVQVARSYPYAMPAPQRSKKYRQNWRKCLHRWEGERFYFTKRLRFTTPRFCWRYSRSTCFHTMAECFRQNTNTDSYLLVPQGVLTPCEWTEYQLMIHRQSPHWILHTACTTRKEELFWLLNIVIWSVSIVPVISQFADMDL